MEAEEKKKLDDIHRAIVGNPLDPHAPKGILAQLEEHHITLYGDESREQNGIVKKVTMLWDDRAKVYTVCAVIVFVGGLITWLMKIL